MTRRVEKVEVVCAVCAAPFALTPHAHARRVARYGTHLLCARCLTEGWLRSSGAARHKERALRDDKATSLD